MKYLLAFLLLMPSAAIAQSQADFEQVMSRFVRFYNDGQTDSICSLFPREREGKAEECFWRWAEQHHDSLSSLQEYGRITSYKYLGRDVTDAEPVHVFKVMFSKVGQKAHSFTLDEANRYGTFRFITSSDEIEKMLAR
jgi:hypothetical protein